MEVTIEAITAIIIAIGTTVALFLKRIGNLPGLGSGRPKPVYVKFGQSVILSSWSWWPPGWTRSLISVDKNGDSKVQYF